MAIIGTKYAFLSKSKSRACASLIEPQHAVSSKIQIIFLETKTNMSLRAPLCAS
jgi:hypothetical protein